LKTNLSSNLKTLRAKRGLSQTALSVKAGVFLVGISSIENDRGNPSLSTLSALADALNVSLHDLLCKKAFVLGGCC
jgi:transcriptional regulator with XRE-family HTH domain